MNVYELTKDQRTQLKQHHYCQVNESVSFGELANIDELISDAEIYELYDYIDFVEEDFTNDELM